VGTVSGVLHGLIESGQHETRERKFTFHDDPASCVQEIRDALKDLRDDIKSQEQSLKLQADQIVAELGEPEYLLHRPAGDGGTPGILDTTDPDDVLPERTRITIEPTTMDYLAEDILGEIAAGLRKAGYSMDLTGNGWSFHRSGGIGLGSTGPYDSFSALNDAIAARLEENANIVDQVAEVVLVVKKTFTETDDQVSQDLAALDN
ncbi:MAG: hypothetical protein ACI379_16890, partial [Nocardioides sp.]|uniref:hypothetical protein n=1 Tax=Nocardioides sp. TaxID=35761 RepID=UPI003EFDDD9C